ncbi:PqqD family peptide modification chaperone [Rhodohalobacter sp. 614A]|uniref:PqqD family peptide modification chaperone n=1 Tax=Rhodohalobacter sp. 614A TaxID=2908649 RepID=UPI001F484581|nr:PqqD family peptide modification chaperone [Rhodohalobacter sp. 614A]
MGIAKETYLRVNEPHVVHETIEGEAILLNLSTGNYYSIEWPGTVIWDLICESGDVDGINQAFQKADKTKRNEIEKAFDGFLKTLVEEELLVVDEKSSPVPFEVDKQTAEEFKKAVEKLDKLSLNKYSDMKDMLLLDPIHDVDEKGWPEPKKEPKQEK